MTLAVGYQGTEEAFVLGLPKTRTLGAITASLRGLTKTPRLVYNISLMRTTI
jgi:hypothetical protein